MAGLDTGMARLDTGPGVASGLVAADFIFSMMSPVIFLAAFSFASLKFFSLWPAR
jgi:hypothetical protein